MLDDARLKAQAKSFLDYVLHHQAEDGWIGPEMTRETRGIWARALVLFGMTVCVLVLVWERVNDCCAGVNDSVVVVVRSVN